MRELQRVLGDKRVIIVFVLILIINGLLFYQSMQPDSSLEQQNKELYGDDPEIKRNLTRSSDGTI